MSKFKWKDSAQVAELLGYGGWTDLQFIMLENYIQHGVRPDPDGCLGCDAAFIRRVTGEMDAYAAPTEPEIKDQVTVVFIDPADIKDINAPTVAELNKATKKK